MKWVAISGSWRTLNAEVENDVRAEVRDIVAKGEGIVTGGALGVDYIATDEALKADPAARQLKIILPTSLSNYANHYFRRPCPTMPTIISAAPKKGSLPRNRRKTSSRS